MDKQEFFSTVLGFTFLLLSMSLLLGSEIDRLSQALILVSSIILARMIGKNMFKKFKGQHISRAIVLTVYVITLVIGVGIMESFL